MSDTANETALEWKAAAASAEMRWMSVGDATITLPASLVALHSRQHDALVGRLQTLEAEAEAVDAVIEDAHQVVDGPSGVFVVRAEVMLELRARAALRKEGTPQ